MAKKVKGEASKGSRLWLQVLVNSRPELLNLEICKAFRWKDGLAVRWVSPLKSEAYAEYSDGEFLRAVGLARLEQDLIAFWPAGGPEWDALGVTSNSGVVLIEAKAHIPELVSPGSGAGKKSLDRISERLQDVQADLKVDKEKHDWTKTFYQYANRIAHLHFLRQCHKVDAYLVNVHFLNAADVGGPSSVDRWMGAIDVVHTYLGIGRHKLSKYMADVFIDVNDLSK